MPNNCELEERYAERKQIAISALVKDKEETFSYPCTIRDATRDGCRIHCSEASSLPDEFLLYPVGLAKSLAASVMWRKGKWLGLSIAWEQILFD